MKFTSLLSGLALILPYVLAAALPEAGVASRAIAPSNALYERAQISWLGIDLDRVDDIVKEAQAIVSSKLNSLPLRCQY